MQRYLILLLFTIVVNSQYGQQLSKFDSKFGVYQLNNRNFDQAIRQHRHILVDFYAPWCKPCVEFEPEYYQMAKILYSQARNTIKISSYDATQDPEGLVTKRYKISSYPTFIFFIEGIPFEYEGNRRIDQMMAWMHKIIEAQPPTELKSIEEINEFISAYDLSVLYFGKDNIFQDKNFWTFYQVSKMADEGFYGYTLNELLIKKAGAQPNTLLVYNNLKEGDSVRRKFNQAFTAENLQRFITQATLPDIPPINEKSDQLIFGGNTPAFILFINYDQSCLDAEKAFTSVSQMFKQTYQFVISRITDELFFRTLDKLGADDRKFPQLIAVQPPYLRKYLYQGNDFSVEGIKKFIFDYRQNKVPRFIKSEPLPGPQNLPVKKVVALSWDVDIQKQNKDVLLEIHAQSCKPCKEFAPQYDLLAFSFQDNKNLMVAKIDGGENELPVKIQSYPTFFFFKGSDKNKRPIEYDGNRTIPLLQEFIKNHTSYDWIEPKQVE